MFLGPYGSARIPVPPPLALPRRADHHPVHHRHHVVQLAIWHMTGSQYRGKYHSGCVPKNLTLCRMEKNYVLVLQLSNNV